MKVPYCTEFIRQNTSLVTLSLNLNLAIAHLMPDVAFGKPKNGSIKAMGGGLVMEGMPKFGKNLRF